MPPVIAARTWVIVVPVAIVNWYLHLRWITVVHTIAALIILTAAIVLWVEHIRIVVESRAVAAPCSPTPCLTISHCLRCLCIARIGVVGRIRSQLSFGTTGCSHLSRFLLRVSRTGQSAHGGHCNRKRHFAKHIQKPPGTLSVSDLDQPLQVLRSVEVKGGVEGIFDTTCILSLASKLR